MVIVRFSVSIFVNTSVNVSRRVSPLSAAPARGLAHSSIDKKTATANSVAMILFFIFLRFSIAKVLLPGQKGIGQIDTIIG